MFFKMHRSGDESGVSGTGYILEGVKFSDGTVVIRWTVKGMPNSTAIYPDFGAFRKIHVDSHPSNNTKIEWYEPGNLVSIETQR